MLGAFATLKTSQNPRLPHHTHYPFASLESKKMKHSQQKLTRSTSVSLKTVALLILLGSTTTLVMATLPPNCAASGKTVRQSLNSLVNPDGSLQTDAQRYVNGAECLQATPNLDGTGRCLFYSLPAYKAEETNQLLTTPIFFFIYKCLGFLFISALCCERHSPLIRHLLTVASFVSGCNGIGHETLYKRFIPLYPLLGCCGKLSKFNAFTCIQGIGR